MTLNFDLMKAHRYVARADTALRERGLIVSISTDFDAFLRHAQNCRGKPPTPYFDPRYSDICEKNGFWIAARDWEGQIIHLQAARMDDLGKRSLADFLESLDAYYIFPEEFRKRGEYCRSPAQATKKLCGRVVYHGEFWLRSGPSGAQGRGLVSHLSALATGLVAGRWHPDFSYAMVQPRIVRCGIADKYGFNHKEPHGILWSRPDAGEYLDEWIVWRNKYEIIEQIERAEDTGCLSCESVERPRRPAALAVH